MEFVNYTQYNKAIDLKRLKFIADNLPIKDNEPLHILEVGCGNGNICYQLARYGNIVTGIDISQTAINYAMSNFGNTPGLQFKVMDAHELKPAKNEKYDVIVCSEVLEHLQRPEQLVDHFKELLTEHGIVILTVPNGFGPREVLITKPVQRMVKSEGLVSKSLLKLKHSLSFKGDTKQTSAESLEHIQFFTVKHLKSLAEPRGFKITKVKSGDFIATVFPFSLLSRNSVFLQKMDNRIADMLPLGFTSEFFTVWEQH